MAPTSDKPKAGAEAPSSCVGDPNKIARPAPKKKRAPRGRPTKSEANGIRFRIDWVPLGSILTEPDEEGEQAECYGMCHTDLHKIEVSDGLEHDRERRTVLHECLHQIIHCSALELPDDLEETVVRFLDSALLGHMRRNPALWRYLLTPPPHED